MKRLCALLIAIAAVIGAGYWAEWSLRPAEAVLVLTDVEAGATPSLLKRITPRPDRQKLVAEVDGRRLVGDLYLPGAKAGAGVVLVPGAGREGKDDPRLVALATTLARARFVVLVPDMPNLRTQEIAPGDTQVVADAARYLLDERRSPKVGAAAVSYAGIPAVLAALAEPRLDFVIGIGIPFDLTAVITYLTTGAFRDGPDQPWQYGQPNAYGKWAFVKSNAARLDDSGDRALLAAIAVRKMGDADADITALRAGLKPPGQAVMALLDNGDPARVPALMAALPPALRTTIAAMDPARRDLAALHARLFLVHGRDDRIVPWTESAALARRAPQAELALVDNLSHADLRPGQMADTLALWRMVLHLLAQRDPPSPAGS